MNRWNLLAFAMATVLVGCGEEKEITVQIRNDLKVIQLKSVKYGDAELAWNVSPVSSKTREFGEDWQDRYCGKAHRLEIELVGPLGTAKVRTVEEVTIVQGHDRTIVIDDSTKFLNF